MLKVSISFPATVSLCRHNLRERDNLILVGNLHTQITVVNHNTAHECRLQNQLKQHEKTLITQTPNYNKEKQKESAILN